jgi:hypothetical protein
MFSCLHADVSVNESCSFTLSQAEYPEKHALYITFADFNGTFHFEIINKQIL